MVGWFLRCRTVTRSATGCDMDDLEWLGRRVQQLQARVAELEAAIRYHRQRMADHPAVLADVGGPDMELWSVIDEEHTV